MIIGYNTITTILGSKMSTLESSEETKRREEQIRDAIMSKLISTGEKERLKEFLRQKLQETGWQEELREYSKAAIRKKGTEKVSVEELVNEIIPHGKSTVSEEVKAEFLRKVRESLENH